MDREALIRRLEEIVGPQGVISERNQLRTYECDGLAAYTVVPGLVVLAPDTATIRDVVRLCNELDVPFVARGSGTGLSGGALPHADGVLIEVHHKPEEALSDGPQSITPDMFSSLMGDLRQIAPVIGRRL